MTLLAAYGSVGASSRRQVPVADNGQPGSYQLTRRVSTDKRARVYRHSFTWTKSRLFAEVLQHGGFSMWDCHPTTKSNHRSSLYIDGFCHS
jgi:hypothetical protein